MAPFLCCRPADRSIHKKAVCRPSDSASPGRHQPTSLREALLFEKWSRTLRVCLMADFYAHAPLAAAAGARASCVGTDGPQSRRHSRFLHKVLSPLPCRARRGGGTFRAAAMIPRIASLLRSFCPASFHSQSRGAEHRFLTAAELFYWFLLRASAALRTGRFINRPSAAPAFSDLAF